ncbi:MAG: SCO family protein [Alphaproteobacteria bacterium]|nr:SCO family protein [Alphaproteobacteria bacterium]
MDDEQDGVGRREFLKAGVAGAVGVAGVATGMLLSTEDAAAQQAAKSLQTLLATNGTTARLIDQSGEVFKPDVLKDKVTIALSGFYGCPACKKIKATLEAAVKQLQGKEFEVVVFNLYPENDSREEVRAKYAKEYEDIGLKPEQLHILFRQTKKSGRWDADSEAANVMENSLMNDTTRGHSTSIFVFDKNGNRMSKGGTFSAGTPEARPAKADNIVKEVNKALGLQALLEPDDAPARRAELLRTLNSQGPGRG